MIGIYVSIGLGTLILVLIICMAVEKIRKKHKRITEIVTLQKPDKIDNNSKSKNSNDKKKKEPEKK